MMKLDRFTRGSRHEGGKHLRYQYARCGACLATGEVRDTGDSWHPPEAVAKKLEQRGWFIGKTAAKDRCPACCRRPETAPAKEGEEDMALKPTPAVTVKEVPSPILPPVRAEPPREPTPAQRRSIRETLELRYDEDKACYIDAQSDATIAEALQVPRAWVTQVREAGGYGPDTNELASQRLEGLRELAHRGEDLHAKAMAMADQCLQLAGQVETYMADVRKALT